MLTQRLGFDNQKSEEYIKELIEIIKRNPGSCDEIWLATDYGFPSLDTHRKSAELLGKSAKLLREAGIRVSLQLSNTLGHGDYMGVRDCSGLVYNGSGAEHFVDIDGVRANYSFCWYGKNFRAYTSEMIKIYCRQIQPYRVWIDDDFRYDNHHPSDKGCMCDDCIARYNKKYGTDFDRPSLKNAVLHGDSAHRRNFAQFIKDGICELAEVFTADIISASPESSVGYQHGAGGLPADKDFADIFRAFEKASGKTVGTRPGAGTYNDHNPSDMISKLDSIRYQNSLTEGAVDEIRPEIENFPHVCFGKSPAGTCYETSLYLAGGATAMSYATMMYDFEPLSWHEEMFRAFAAHRKYWEKLSSLNKGTFECGLTHYLPEDIWERELPDNENGFGWTQVPWYTGNEIQRCGMPISFRRSSKKPLYMLTAEIAAMMSGEDVKYLTGHPVICGGDALEILCNRGFGEYFGAEAHSCDTVKLFEIYTDHKANCPSGGRRWENGLMQRQGSYILDKNGDIEVLGYYGTDGTGVTPVDPSGEHPYGISSAIIKTSAGASWAVFGQYPWTPVISWSKRHQLLKAADIISDSRIPAVSTGRQQVLLLARENTEMLTTSVTVLNTTVGVAEGIVLSVRRPAGSRARIYLPDGTIADGEAYICGNELKVRLPAVMPWNTCTVCLV